MEYERNDKSDANHDGSRDGKLMDGIAVGGGLCGANAIPCGDAASPGENDTLWGKDAPRRNGMLQPFAGCLVSQEGVVQTDDTPRLSSEEIVNMRLPAHNVIGSLPTEENA